MSPILSKGKGLFIYGRILVCIPLLTLYALPAKADNSAITQPSPALSNPLGASLLSGALACGNAFEQTAAAGSDCLMEQAVNLAERGINELLLNKAAHFANAYGRRLFGEHFSLANRLTYSPLDGGFSGELDTVIPLASFAAFTGGEGAGVSTTTFFLQQGITRYTDSQGLLRNDLRYGAVHRFNLSSEPGANVVGLSTFFQQNLEYGHGRVVTGLDYDGDLAP